MRIINTKLARENAKMKDRIDRDREIKAMWRSRCGRQRRVIENLRGIKSPTT